MFEFCVCCASERTKAALAAKKASDARLGNPHIAAAGSIGRTVQITAADEFAAGLLPIVNAIRATGTTTLEAIMRALNDTEVFARDAERPGTFRQFPTCLLVRGGSQKCASNQYAF
jgi:hypothetical protein